MTPPRPRARFIRAQDESRVQTVCLLVIAGAISAAALYLLQPVMIPLALALLLTYVLDPVVEFSAERLRFPRSLAIFMSMALGGAILFALGYLISASIEDLLSSGELYHRRLLELATEFGVPIAPAEVPLAPPEETLSAKAFEGLPVSEWATGLADYMVDAATNFVLVLVFTCYMLMGTARTARSDREDTLRRRVASRVKRYLSIKLLLSALTGLLVGASLQIIGIELALLFGVFAFILNFIPNIGSIISTLVPLPVVLFNPEYDTTTLMLVLFVPGTIQFIIGNVAEPMLIGGELHLHPVAVLAALVFWGVLWGAPGLLLAVPLTAALRIAAESMELTRPVARLLEGKLDYLDGADEFDPVSGVWNRPPPPPKRRESKTIVDKSPPELAEEADAASAPPADAAPPREGVPGASKVPPRPQPPAAPEDEGPSSSIESLADASVDLAPASSPPAAEAPASIPPAPDDSAERPRDERPTIETPGLDPLPAPPRRDLDASSETLFGHPDPRNVTMPDPPPKDET